MNLSEPVRHNPSAYSFAQWNALELTRRATRLRKLYSIEDRDIKEHALKADYLACKDSLQYYIEQYGWLANPQEDQLREFPFVLFDEQVLLVNVMVDSILDGYPLLVNKGRELGVSWLMLYGIFHGWRFSSRFSAKVGSRKEDLVDDSTLDSLFGKLRYMLNKLPPHLREKNIKDINMQLVNNRNKSEIIGEATNEGFGRGGRKTVLLLDEFAHVLPGIANNIWKAVDTVAKTRWIPSTPRGKGNKFYELYSTLPKRSIFEIKWNANPYRDDAWKKDRLTVLTEDEFDQEHEASFAAIRVGKIFSSQRDSVIYNDDPGKSWFYKKDKARQLWVHVGGWDFGSGPSLTVCLMSLLEFIPPDPFPVIWLDDEISWKSAGVQTIAQDTLVRMGQYGSHVKLHFGDPAGKNRESDQSSWIDNLAGYGIPIQQLDQDTFNTSVGIDTNIKLIQRLLDSGKLRIHERCRMTWEALEQWRYDVPDNIPIELVSKAWIAPRKDGYSHSMNALLYLCGAVYRYMHRVEDPDLSKLKNKSGSSFGLGTLSGMLGAARRV